MDYKVDRIRHRDLEILREGPRHRQTAAVDLPSLGSGMTDPTFLGLSRQQEGGAGVAIAQTTVLRISVVRPRLPVALHMRVTEVVPITGSGQSVAIESQNLVHQCKSRLPEL
jgi:hypothetical protein